MSRSLILASACLFVGSSLMAAAAPKSAPPRNPKPIGYYRPTPFPDVPKTHWAYEAVELMRKLGILRGYPPVKLAPLDPAKLPPLR